jgi:hypothetical protein
MPVAVMKTKKVTRLAGQLQTFSPQGESKNFL